MANTDQPNGFRVLYQGEGLGRYTASATIAKGDLVVMVSGKILPFAIGTHTEAIGVAMQAAVNNDTNVIVAHDPNALFIAQCSGAYTAATHDGTRVDVEGTTGIMEVNEDASTKGILQILRQYTDESGATETGANARVVVKIAQHQLASMTASDPGTTTFDQVNTDTIGEKTSAAGVTVDSVLLKDGKVDGAEFTAPTATVGGKLDLFEGTDNGTNKVTLAAGDNLAANRTLTLPSAGDLNLEKTRLRQVDETATVGGKVDLFEGTDNGTNKVTLAAPNAITSNRTITLPDADVTLAQLNTLTNSGSGHAHIADAASATAVAITNGDMAGTSNGAFEDILDTSTGDRSGAIENNFKEVQTVTTALIADVADIRTQFNALLARLETAGINAAS